MMRVFELLNRALLLICNVVMFLPRSYWLIGVSFTSPVVYEVSGPH